MRWSGYLAVQVIAVTNRHVTKRLVTSGFVTRGFTAFVGLRWAGSGRRSGLVSFISGLSITGLAVGIALLITVLSVMNGFERELRERILGILPQATLYHRQGMDDWRAVRQQVLANPKVQGAAPFVELQGMLAYRNATAPVMLYGIDSAFESDVSDLPKFVAKEDWKHLRDGDGLILGAGIAAQLGASVGDRISLFIPNKSEPDRLPAFAAIRVDAIVTTHTELDHVLALTRLAVAQHFAGQTQAVSGLRLRFADLFDAPHDVYEVVQQLPYGYFASDWTRTHGNLYQAVSMSKRLVGLLLFLIVGIAAFNVVSTLIMVVIDKQSDIAILRTLGASRGEIMAVFMWQGSVIGLIGTFLGLVLGLLASLGVKDLIALLERVFHVQFLHSDVYPVSYVPSELLWQDFVWVGLVSLLLGLLSTIYPAWRASRVEPAEALRFE